MKTIRNRTHRPIKVPLPQGRTLHLGPRQTGEISVHAVDHEGVRRLVEAGTIEIVGEGAVAPPSEEGTKGQESTHGHHPPTSVKVSGNR